RRGPAGVRPRGAPGGFVFRVPSGMPPPAGCRGEISAWVLRARGSRRKGRPKPAEPAPVPTDVMSPQAVPAEAPSTAEPAAAVLALEGEATAPASDKALEAGMADTPLPESTLAASREVGAHAPDPPPPPPS